MTTRKTPIHQLSEKPWERWLESHTAGLTLITTGQIWGTGEVKYAYDIPATDLVAPQFYEVTT